MTKYVVTFSECDASCHQPQYLAHDPEPNGVSFWTDSPAAATLFDSFDQARQVGGIAPGVAVLPYKESK